MRVLFLSTWFPWPADNGSKIRVYYLLRALAERHEVTLVSFAFGTARPDEKEALRALCRRCEVVNLDPHNATGLRNNLRFFSSIPIAALPKPEMKRTIDEALQRCEFDAVIASTQGMAAYAAQLPDTTFRILEEHNASSAILWERFLRQTTPVSRLRCFVSWYKQLAFESRTLRRFDLCTMVSREDQIAFAKLARGPRPKIELVPNGVDCSRNRPNLAPVEPARMVFNGALTYSANYNAMRYFLTEIYPLIRKELPEASLTITGSTEGVDFSSLNLAEGVRLSGWVDDIRDEVARAAVCVVPIRAGGGTRVKILEAMALGTPVVATRKAAEGLEAENGKHLSVADDAASFAEQTVELMHNVDLRERVRTNARNLVEQRYDWVKIGHRFVELIECMASDYRRKGRP